MDFFFVLSGFVVGYAYDDRWDRMSVGGFFKRRLIRLHPDAPLYAHIMVAAGVLLMAVGTAYACLKLYDIPVRKWLTDKFMRLRKV